MTEQSNRLFFALIRNSLLGTPLPEDLTYTPSVWAETFRAASDHDLTQLIFDAVSCNHLLAETSVGFQKGKEQYLLAQTRVVKIEETQTKVMQVLEKAKINFVLLKGSVLRPLYPAPWMRTSCDIDILVRPEDIKRAGDIMVKALAFAYSGDRTSHDISLYDEGGVHLEIHHRLEHNSKTPNVVLQAVWENLRPLAGMQHGYQMTPEFFSYYHLTHMQMHLLSGGCGIRSCLDWQIIQINLPYNRERVSEWLSQTGLTVFADAVQTVSRHWLSDTPMDAVGEKLAAFIINGGCFGTEESLVVTQRSVENGHAKYFLRRIFLPYCDLCNLYPWLIRRKWLYPIAAAFRWLSVLNPTKRKRLQAEVKTAICTANTVQNDVKALLDALHLTQTND